MATTDTAGATATATAIASVPEHRSTVPAKRTNLGRVLSSEWIKTRSLRSTWITLGTLALVIVAFGVLAAMAAGGDIQGPQGGPPGVAGGRGGPMGTVLAGANVAVLLVAVFGSVVGAREFASGMIRTTFAAVPRRLPVLASKLVVFVAVVLPVVLAALVAVFFAGMAVLDRSGAATLSWSDDGVVRTLVGHAYYLVGLGVIGLALGVMLRGTAAAIGTTIGAVLFLPALATALLPSDWSTVLKYLPSNAGNAFSALTTTGDVLTPWQGFAVFTGWVVLAVVGAVVTLVRRDA
ncbi:ABC transporter permease [Nakamurella sp.]|uniref:ABC transporter permease n=1 Tax=Nakamurella sp. TaxID=1869182 RepID=UPI003B3A3523